MASTPWIKKYEDLKLRTPEKCLNWAVSAFQLRPVQLWTVSPADTTLRTKEGTLLELSNVLHYLMQAAGYTNTIGLILNGDFHYAFVFYETRGKWYWMDIVTATIKQFPTRENLFLAVKNQVTQETIFSNGYESFQYGLLPDLQKEPILVDDLRKQLEKNHWKPAFRPMFSNLVLTESTDDGLASSMEVVCSSILTYTAYGEKINESIASFQYFEYNSSIGMQLLVPRPMFTIEQLAKHFLRALFQKFSLRILTIVPLENGDAEFSCLSRIVENDLHSQPYHHEWHKGIHSFFHISPERVAAFLDSFEKSH